MPALEQAWACFSEIDTESSTQESNRIAYLEQYLRLQEPSHLSPTQASGRRFLLDMLHLLSRQPSSGQSAQQPLDGPYRIIRELLNRTAHPSLASAVTESQGIHTLNPADFVALVEWMDAYGIGGRELALLQPDFFMGKGGASSTTSGIHPQFAELVGSSMAQRYDYLAQVFLAEAEPMRLVPKEKTEQRAAGIGEALASLYDRPHDPEAAMKSRLKAFFIPNRHGEPIIALSFVSED